MTHLVLLLAALLQATSPSVEGVAVRSDRGEPVPHARVMLTRTDGRLADARVVDADERGRFVFRAVAPGSYRVSAHDQGFIRGESRAIAVTSGQSIGDVVLTMTPTGVITGRVVDEYGDPAARVYVRATSRESTFEAQTNDLGEYRLFDLPPGSYIVSAMPYYAARIEGGTLIVPTPPGPYARGEGQGMQPTARLLQSGDFLPFMAVRGESYAGVYYPDAIDPAAATPIQVAPGAVVGAIDLRTAISR